MTWNRLVTSTSLETTCIIHLQTNFRKLHDKAADFTVLRAVLLNAAQDMSNGDISSPTNIKTKVLP